MGELVLITGTSSGIGLATAVACAKAGHAVVATLRHIETRGALETAAAEAGVRLSVETLDVTSDVVGVKVRELILKYGPFFAVVNNAGIGVGGAFEEQSEADIREQFETNVFGTMEVTRAVLPSMRAAGRGRIINVSSMQGRVGLPCVSAYAATKHAIEGFSESLRWELEAFGVSVHLVEPGTTRTPMVSGKERRGALVSGQGPYAALHEWVERVVKEEAERAPAPEIVGARIAEIVSAERPSFRTIIGRDASALVALRRALPDRVFASGVRFYSRYRGA
jgi:NAD(P)-dependent dehydrogenase (short-subunit alcohol dehydrogenase family)